MDEEEDHHEFSPSWEKMYLCGGAKEVEVWLLHPAWHLWTDISFKIRGDTTAKHVLECIDEMVENGT